MHNNAQDNSHVNANSKQTFLKTSLFFSLTKLRELAQKTAKSIAQMTTGWPMVWIAAALYTPEILDMAEPFMDGKFIEHSGVFVRFDMLMHTMALFLCGAALLSRTIKPIHITAALLLTQLASNMGADVFSTYLHPWLIEHQLYPEHFGRGNSSTQSNQYAKMLLGCIALAALAVTMMRRQWRSLDRVFIFLSVASILGTSVLFHFVIRESIFESRIHQRAVMRMAAEAPEPWIFDAICKHHDMQCFQGAARGKAPITGNAEVDAITRKALDHKDSTKGCSFATTGSMPAIGTSRLAGYHVLYHCTQDGSVRIVLETTQWSQTLQKFQLVYSWVAIPAHLLWLIGPLELIFWHKRRFQKRAPISQSKTAKPNPIQ